MYSIYSSDRKINIHAYSSQGANFHLILFDQWMPPSKQSILLGHYYGAYIICFCSGFTYSLILSFSIHVLLFSTIHLSQLHCDSDMRTLTVYTLLWPPLKLPGSIWHLHNSYATLIRPPRIQVLIISNTVWYKVCCGLCNCELISLGF